MTNNPTIDGVSREPEVFLRTFEIRKQMPVDTCHILGAPVTASSFVDREVVLLDDHRQRVAALQSTIARLEARITQLESEKEFAAATYQAARDRIAELEIAQPLDNPTAYLRNEGEPNNLVVCGFDHPDALKVFRVPPAPVAVAMSFEFEHPSSKEKRTVTLTKRDVFDGMEDYFYDKLGEQICQCESVGETNVVDCNCDEYVHDFEIVNACLDAAAALNGVKP